MRIEDKQEDHIEEERRRSEKQTRAKAEQFKQSVLAQVQNKAPVLPKSKKFVQGKEDIDTRKEAAKTGKKDSPRAGRVKIEAILEELQGEEVGEFDKAVTGKQSTKSERYEKTRSGAKTAKTEEKRLQERESKDDASSEAELPVAIERPIARREDATGFGASGDESDGNQETAFDTSLFIAKSTAAEDIRRFRTPLTRQTALPQALLRHIVHSCERVLSDASQRMVELTLSRHLFAGMTIRVSAIAARIGVEFITQSPDVAAFFEGKKQEIITHLEKRGLAVDKNRVIVRVT